MAHVTEATAAALKAAGFPQPEPAIGQMWGFVRFPEGTARHYKTGIVCQYDYERLVIWCGLGEFEWLKPADQTFHPTATDILAEIGDARWALIKNGDWQIVDLDDVEFDSNTGITNPAEVAANLYLQLSAAT